MTKSAAAAAVAAAPEAQASPPPSAVPGWGAGPALGLFLLTFQALRGRPCSPFCRGLLLLAAYALPWMLIEGVRFFRTYRPRYPLRWRDVLYRTVGLYVTLGMGRALYALFPEYTQGWEAGFYQPYARLLDWLLPGLLLGAPFYFAFIGRYVPPEEDTAWWVGRFFVQGGRVALPRRHLQEHVLAWLVKGYFLPLMFVWFIQHLTFVEAHWQWPQDFKSFYDLVFAWLYLVDVTGATVGYMMGLRLFNAHVRSTEKTFFGWAVALLCYQPFYGAVVGRLYLAYENDDFMWGAWLWDHPGLYALWGSLILVLLAVYVWATLAFGLRFSNLTHRGILTHGPYRFCKHPAYVAKNLTWWLIAVPFIPHQGLGAALQGMGRLLLLNGLYALRAWTEERHLASVSAEYRAYQAWMAEHGLGARVRRAFSRLRGWVIFYG